MTKYIHLRFGNQPYLFTFRPGFLLLCLLFFCIFCTLGIWQIHRYHFKKNLLTTYENRVTAPAKPLLNETNISLKTHEFMSVYVKGTYANGFSMYVQNQYHNNQIGFEVLTPLKINNVDKFLLVDRGWIPLAHSHDLLNTINKEQDISGYLKWINEYHFILGKNIIHPNHHPLIMQKIDIAEISRLTHKNYYPFILRLNAKDPSGFAREWVITASPPERHLAYAVQWFALAFVLLIAYFCFCLQKSLEETSHA